MWNTVSRLTSCSDPIGPSSVVQDRTCTRVLPLCQAMSDPGPPVLSEAALAVNHVTALSSHSALQKPPVPHNHLLTALCNVYKHSVPETLKRVHSKLGCLSKLTMGTRCLCVPKTTAEGLSVIPIKL